MNKQSIKPPRTWEDPTSHYKVAVGHPWYRLLMSVSNTVAMATHEFWNERGVLHAALPITTGSISSPMGLGSDSEPVAVTINGADTYLADSMQFGLEYACRLNKRGAYYFMPSFRGERTDPTHLSQFYHSEAEFPGTLQDMINLVQEYIVHLAQEVLNTDGAAIKKAGGELAHLESAAQTPSFHQIEFDEAVSILDDNPKYVTHSKDDSWRGLTRAGEKVLMEQYGEFLWVTHFDELSVPFYQARNNAGQAKNADLLFGIGETVGGGERHGSSAELTEALERHAVDPSPYEWYMTLRDIAPVKTSGFGMGVERFLMWVLQTDDIRAYQLLLRENDKTITP